MADEIAKSAITSSRHDRDAGTSPLSPLLMSGLI